MRLAFRATEVTVRVLVAVETDDWVTVLEDPHQHAMIW